MTEITLRPGQEPEPRPGPWPQQQDILYCENTGCLIRRRQRPAAVTLMGIWSGALTLSCDECARRQYNHLPGSYRVLPLSEYRDWYAEARSQMQDAVTVVTAEVIDEACARAAAPSPAPVVPQAAAISARGPVPAPAAAAGGPPPGSSPGAPAASPGKKMSRQAARTLLGAGIAVTACVAFGIFLITWGEPPCLAGRDLQQCPLEFLGRRLHPDAVVDRDRLGSHRGREVLGSAAPPVPGVEGKPDAAAAGRSRPGGGRGDDRRRGRHAGAPQAHQRPAGQQRHGTHHARRPHDAAIGQARVLPPAGAMRYPAQQPPHAPRNPTEASQEAIMRFRPGYRDPETGTYKTLP